MGRSFYVETLGCPKNQVDSDKLVGQLLADGMIATDDPGERRPRGRQHLRLRRGRPQGVGRHDPGPGRRAGGDGSRLVVTGCLAERSGAELADGHARDRRRGRLRRRRAGHARAQAPLDSPDASTCLHLLRPARPPRRGPTSRWPRAATGRAGSAPSLPSAGPQRSRVDRRASAARSTTSPPAWRRRRSCSSPRTWPPTGATRASGSGRSCPLVESVAAAVDRGSGCSTCIRSTSPTSSSGCSCEVGRALRRPVAAARVPPAGAAHAALGRRRPVPGPHRLHPPPAPDAAFRSNFIVGYPGRDRGRPRRACSAFVADAQPRLVRLLRLLARRTAPTPPASTARSPAPLVRERLAELTELQDPITAEKRDELVGYAGQSRSWTALASARRTGKRRRSTASSPCPTTSALDAPSTSSSPAARGPDLEAARP